MNNLLRKVQVDDDVVLLNENRYDESRFGEYLEAFGKMKTTSLSELAQMDTSFSKLPLPSTNVANKSSSSSRNETSTSSSWLRAPMARRLTALTSLM